MSEEFEIKSTVDSDKLELNFSGQLDEDANFQSIENFDFTQIVLTLKM